MNRTKTTSTALCLLLTASTLGSAQWTNRYPKVEGYRHHVYLEGFELPILASGPTDPAPSPDGRSLAFAARGWLWLLDLETGTARRLTNGGPMDARPAWSPDGERIAFLRDDTRDLDVWVLDLASGEERPLAETPAIDLDPAYSSDGAFLYYSSAEAGDLDVWRLQLATGERARLTTREGLEVRPLPLPDGDSFVFVSKGPGGPDRIVRRDGAAGSDVTIRSQSIASQTHPGLSPDGRTLAVNWPGPEGYDLDLIDLGAEDAIRLNRRPRLPLAPAFGPSGETVYFAEAGPDLRFELFEVPVRGGEARLVPIRSWDWNVPTGRIEIRTTRAGRAAPVPARLHVTDASGHPAVPDAGIPRFDMTHGKVYFYSPGVIAVEVPAGAIRVEAARGFSAPAVVTSVTVAPGETEVVELAFEPLWEPRADGWYAGDHHYHMNYGGPYRLEPADLLLPLQAEDMDVGTPLMANLHHRFNDLEHFSYRRVSELPFLAFGQEIRSHFLGHLGLIHIDEPFWPWYWGPGYPVYGSDDRPNDEALRFARRQGGVASYMHPVSVAEPFRDEEAMRSIPINVIPDAVLGELDALEVACLWISEMGTHELWYRLLDVGAPVAASAGTDIMADYYRTMAVGATRIYVRVEDPVTFDRYVEAYAAGRSFVSTGPLLDFRVAGKQPGEVVPAEETEWTLKLSTVVPVEAVEILVNGEVVRSLEGRAEPGEERYAGTLALPEGGWIAARARGGEERWPGMNGFPFAHTSPVWIGERFSTEPAAARRSAGELLAALEVAERRLREGYAGHPIPELEARFRAAREHLARLAAP